MPRRRLPSAPVGLTLAIIVSALAPAAAAARVPDRPRAAPRASALLGNARVRTNLNRVPTGTIKAFSFLAGVAGSADRIHLYADRRSRARSVVIALYSDVDRRPGLLLRRGQTRARAGRWNTVAISPRAITAGRRYWIAALPRGGRLVVRDQRGGRCGASSTAPRTRQPPKRWRPGKSGSACPASAYLSGTRALALTPPPAGPSGSPVPTGPTAPAQAPPATGTGAPPPTTGPDPPPPPPPPTPDPPPPTAPGEPATVTVTNAPGATLQTQLSTNNVWPFLMDDGPSTKARFNALHAPLVRIHAGDDGGYPALPELKQNQWSFTNLNELVDNVFDSGQTPLMNPKFAPDWQWTCTRLYTSGTVRDQTFQEYAQYLARLVDYYNNGSMTTETGQTIVNPAGTSHRIVYWEPWNEPDLNNETPCAPPSGNGLTPQQYVTMWNAVTAAMLAKDPGLKFVGPATAGSQFGSSTATGNQYVDLLMTNSQTKPSAISFHGYGYWDNSVRDKWLFDGDNSEPAAKCCGGITDLLVGIQTIRASYPSLPVWLTEVNVNADWGDDPHYRPSSELAAAWWGALFQQTAPAGAGMIHQYDAVDGPQFGLIDDQTSNTYVGYHVFQLLNRAFPPGSRLLPTASSASGVLPLAAARPDGKISVMVVDRQLTSNTVNSTCGTGGLPATVTLSLSGVTPAAATRSQIDKTNVSCTGAHAATAPIAQSLDPAAPLVASLPGYGIAVFEITPG